MNKTIVTGLFITLIVLVGCTQASYTCYNPDNPDKVAEVSTVSTPSHEAYILEECRKKLCEVVITKVE